MTDQLSRLMAMVDEERLSKALQKILRVSQAWGDEELEKWVRLELHGYWSTNPALTEEVVVPEYRTVAGYFTDDYGRRLTLSDPDMEFVNQLRLRFGVVELEGMVGATGPLSFRAPNFACLIREHLQVEVSTFNFSSRAIPAVLEAIRTQLSDYLLARKDRLPGDVPDGQALNTEDVVELKPNIYGIGVDLRALWRKLQKRTTRDK